MYGDSDPESDLGLSPSQHDEEEDDSHEVEVHTPKYPPKKKTKKHRGRLPKML